MQASIPGTTPGENANLRPLIRSTTTHDVLDLRDLFVERPVLTSRELKELGHADLIQYGHLYGLHRIMLGQSGTGHGRMKALFGGDLHSGNYFFIDVDEAIEYFGSKIKEPISKGKAVSLKIMFMKAGFDEQEAMLIVSKKYSYSNKYLSRIDAKIKKERGSQERIPGSSVENIEQSAIQSN